MSELQPLDFENLINRLDAQIVDAKKAAETTAKRVEAEKKHQRLRIQLDALEARLRAMLDVPMEVPADVVILVDAMRAEERTLASEIASYAVPAVVPTVISPELRASVVELAQEIRMTEMTILEHEERQAALTVWSTRWRILAEAAGQENIKGDRDWKAVYALLKERIAIYPLDRFIPALQRDRTAHWEGLLAQAEQELTAAKDMGVRRRETRCMLDEVTAMAAYPASLDDEALKKARHLTRYVARVPSFRDDLANAVAPLREKLGSEFDFLWADDVAETKEPTAKMTRRAIVSRIVSRMISKALIGECHGPIDKIYKGFPGHDYGRAKEALDLLIREGVIRHKVTQGGRISLENKWVTPCEKFVAGQPLGVKSIDDWCVD